MPTRFSRDGAKAAGVATLGMAGAALALAALNRVVSAHAPPPQPPLGDDPHQFVWSEGNISYTVAGQGPAIILLHGIYAGASSFEFRRIFAPLAKQFRVFAPDLPGFGLSTGAPRLYTPELYINAIRDFAQQVAGGADHPVHVIASSLACAFAIEAALTRPDMFDRLVLIAPTGIEALAQPPTVGQRLLGNLLRTPLLGASLYNALVSRGGLRSFLTHQVYRRRDEVSDDLIDAYYAVSHQPHARWAAASFIGGDLNLDIADAYGALAQPVLICWGKEATFTPLDQADLFLERNERAEIRVFERSGSLPHDEEAPLFVTEVSQWLGQGISSRRR